MKNKILLLTTFVSLIICFIAVMNCENKAVYREYGFWNMNQKHMLTKEDKELHGEHPNFLDFYNIDYYKKRVWGFPSLTQFKISNERVPIQEGIITYVMLDTLYNEDLYLFSYKNNKIRLGSHAIEFDFLKKDWVDYKKDCDVLWVNFTGSYEPLLILTELPIEYTTSIGKVISLGRKDEVIFFNYKYKDIYEFYIVYYSQEHLAIDTMLWIDKNFNIIRLERLSDGFIRIPD